MTSFCEKVNANEVEKAMSPQVRNALSVLANHEDTYVGVISGQKKDVNRVCYF